MSSQDNSDSEQVPQGDFDGVIDRLKSANNVLVTVSTDPSVDQLAACIGLTLVLNKLDKHATAVFSGKVPSTIEFLKPESVIEKNTNSLRDFIIALDKAKADKLRYKVEDQVVKIFITPYKTSITEKDLDYSQGDFNVDVVIALGVHDKNQLDSSILAHGRILHDATVISVNNTSGSQLGSLNWMDTRASSLSEMAADVARDLSQDVFDKQNATAFLTGIVAETDRYSNEKAAPHTMSIAGVLMSAGASTQLVSTKLDEGTKQEKQEIPPKDDQSTQVNGDESAEQEGNDDGEIVIEHDSTDASEESNQIDIDEHGEIRNNESSTDEMPQLSEMEEPQSRLASEPPQFGGQLTANTIPEHEQYTGSTDPLTNLPETKIIDREDGASVDADDGTASSASQAMAAPDDDDDINDDDTLEEIEESVNSPHLDKDEKSENGTPPPPVPPPMMPPTSS